MPVEAIPTLQKRRCFSRCITCLSKCAAVVKRKYVLLGRKCAKNLQNLTRSSLGQSISHPEKTGFCTRVINACIITPYERVSYSNSYIGVEMEATRWNDSIDSIVKSSSTYIDAISRWLARDHFTEESVLSKLMALKSTHNV